MAKISPPWEPKGENLGTGNQWCKDGAKAYEFTGVKKSEMPGFEPIAMPADVTAGYAYFDGFHEGLAAAMTKDKHWVYLNLAGKVQIELAKDCSNAQAFSEDLAAVSLGGTPWKNGAGHCRINANKGAKFGFIDKTGKFIIAARFPCPDQWNNNSGVGSQFQNGLAVATDTKSGDVAFGFVNRHGTFVVPPIYTAVGEFSEGLAPVKVGADPPAPIERGDRDERPARYKEDPFMN